MQRAFMHGTQNSPASSRVLDEICAIPRVTGSHRCAPCRAFSALFCGTHGRAVTAAHSIMFPAPAQAPTFSQPMQLAVVHEGIHCDSCGANPIRTAVRYKCLQW